MDDVFTLTEKQLLTCPFFVVKQGKLSANATRLPAYLTEAQTRPLPLPGLSTSGPPSPARTGDRPLLGVAQDGDVR